MQAMKITVVEDEHSIREMYRLKLELSGFQVITASHGVEGFEVIKSFKPDLVMIDLKMPGMTGDKLLEKLRETSWGASIRTIVLTNISKDEAPASLRFLNVDRYIVKAHHTPSQVVDVVKEILDKKPLNVAK
jgi:DNA-binding response OmpR family regulator